MKTIVVTLPDDMKAKLDAKRTQGYTIAGFVRQALAAALVDMKGSRPKHTRAA